MVLHVHSHRSRLLVEPADTSCAVAAQRAVRRAGAGSTGGLPGRVGRGAESPESRVAQKRRVAPSRESLQIKPSRSVLEIMCSVVAHWAISGLVRRFETEY